MATIIAKQGALASTFGAIASIGNATTKVIDATAKSADFLDNLVEFSLQDQQDRYILEREEKRENRLLQFAQRETETKIKVEQFCAQSERHSALFEASLEKYRSLLNNRAETPSA